MSNEWEQYALCAQTDPVLFFPEVGGAEDYEEAKRVCLSCTVRTQCLQAAIDRNEQWGVWGGLSRKERRALKRYQYETTV